MTAQEYLLAHTLDEKYVTEKLGWVLSDEIITIPIYDENGKLLYCKYRHLNSKPKFSFEKGGHPALYCSHKITKHGSVVLCEGEPDVARLWQIGIPAVTGTSGVATFNATLAEPLRGKKVYLCLDSDEAGQKEIEAYCAVLEQVEATVKIVEIPKPFKDVSDFLSANKDNDKVAFGLLMKNASDVDSWLDAHEPAEFAIESNADLLEADIPTPKWLVEKIVPAEGFTFIFGPEGSGKSFYTLTLAQSIAYGEPWLGEFKVQTKTKVLFIDKENTRSLTKSRLKGLGYTDPDHRIFRIVFPEHFELVDEKGGHSAFLRAIARKIKREGIGCVVVDSFTDVMIGDENSRGDVQSFFDSFRQTIPGVPFITLHHANKGSSVLPKASQDRVRGSTNIPAQASSMFFVKPIPKVTNEYALEQTKSRISRKLPAFKVQLVIHKDPENEGETIVTKLLYGGVYEDREEKSADCIAIINEVFSNQDSIYRKELIAMCEEAGISEDTFTRTINSMIESKEVTKEYSKKQGEGNQVIYTRPIEKKIYG